MAVVLQFALTLSPPHPFLLFAQATSQGRPARRDAMAKEGSRSSAFEQGGGKLPLIWCHCKMRRVTRLVSGRPKSQGRVFYCCPSHQRDGSGCPFWHWEEDYPERLRKVMREGKLDKQDANLVMNIYCQAESSRRDGDDNMHAVAKELEKLVGVFKSICVVCVRIRCSGCNAYCTIDEVNVMSISCL
ncbi:hypothetical protein BS78_01G463900 [Paspalum vaginatum]|nr:hypothetical protein BS78_01G463900 [Paspalum vaginatum]